MTHPAIDVIRDEHRALAAMLQSLRLLTRPAADGGSPPPADFELLRAALFYIDEFPERLHHTKESQLLFPLLRERAPEVEAVLDRLDSDHRHGERAIRDLEHDLLAFEQMGESRREKFVRALERYVDWYLDHMDIEERVVLVAAERALQPADWAHLDAAFALNRDPMTGHRASDAYQPLFRKILHLAPAPIGLGVAR